MTIRYQLPDGLTFRCGFEDDLGLTKCASLDDSPQLADLAHARSNLNSGANKTAAAKENW